MLTAKIFHKNLKFQMLTLEVPTCTKRAPSGTLRKLCGWALASYMTFKPEHAKLDSCCLEQLYVSFSRYTPQIHFQEKERTAFLKQTENCHFIHHFYPVDPPHSQWIGSRTHPPDRYWIPWIIKSVVQPQKKSGSLQCEPEMCSRHQQILKSAGTKSAGKESPLYS